MTKKLLSLFAICIMLFSVFAPSAGAATKNFTDVKKDAWYYDAVYSVVEKGIFAGTSDDLFSPQEPMTRAMFVQVLANYTQNFEGPSSGTITRFTDVSKGAWYYEAVQWAGEKGIVSGVGNGKFAPNNQITRQEMAVMLFNYALKTGQTTTSEKGILAAYNDKSSVADWGETAISWALSNKIIVGTGGSKIEPKSIATRAQVAALFNNTYGLMPTRKTSTTGAGNPQDPDEDYLAAMYMTFGELSGGKNMEPSSVTTIGTTPTCAYTGFTLYPEITAYFDRLTKAAADSQVSYISVPIEEIFPELAGKTAGELYQALGHTSLDRRNDTVYLSYETQNFFFDIDIGADLKADAGTSVIIRYRRAPYQLEITDDNTLSFDYDGQIMFTIDLPESYKSCIVKRSQDYRDESGIHRGGELYFYEPVSVLRQYDTGENLFLYIFFSEYNGTAHDSADMTLVMSRRFELNGKTYQLSVMSDNVITSHSDPEVLASYKALWADIYKLTEGIKINSAANIIITDAK